MYGILKLLFQKKDNQFVGRFHDKYAIVAKNPITNSVSLRMFVTYWCRGSLEKSNSTKSRTSSWLIRVTRQGRSHLRWQNALLSRRRRESQTPASWHPWRARSKRHLLLRVTRASSKTSCCRRLQIRLLSRQTRSWSKSRELECSPSFLGANFSEQTSTSYTPKRFKKLSQIIVWMWTGTFICSLTSTTTEATYRTNWASMLKIRTSTLTHKWQR